MATRKLILDKLSNQADDINFVNRFRLSNRLTMIKCTTV